MGYGDSIMASGFARQAREKYPNMQIVIGDRKNATLYNSVIFKNNPNITTTKDLDPTKQKVWIESYPGNRPYIKSMDDEKIYWDINHKTVPGDLYFDENEINKANNAFEKIIIEWNLKYKHKYKRIILLEPTRMGKQYKDLKKAMTRLGELNRDWGYKKWLKLINTYKDSILFIQSTHKDSVLFDGVYNYESDFRNACAMMSLCDGYLGWEGGLAHAAAALRKKAVVFFGGWIHPSITGYKSHKNIYIDIEGSPCGMRNYCEHCEKCRDLMTVEKVCKELENIL